MTYNSMSSTVLCVYIYREYKYAGGSESMQTTRQAEKERESERRSREISLFYGNEGMKMHKIILASFSGFFMGERKRNEHN
jgi:hypothetical protein